MARQERNVRLRQEIEEACSRLEAMAEQPLRASEGPVPGELYVFSTPVEAAIEWLVVRFDIDDPTTILVAPADDLPLAGRCDVGLWPEFFDRPLTVRASESAWLPASMCADHLRVGGVPEEAVSRVRHVIAGLARGVIPDDPVGASVDADPEHMAWLDQVARARRALEDRAESAPATAVGAILRLAELSDRPPVWLAGAEPNLALAASPGGGVMAEASQNLTPAAPRWAKVPLQTGGALLLAADAGGVRVGWQGSEDTAPPQLTGFGSAGRQVANWTNGERPGFHRAEPDFGWLDGQVVLQAGDGNPQTVTVRL